MPKISLNEIIINNKYLRINSNVDELARSIEVLGLIHPLVINQKNELLSGGRRYSALKKLEWDKAPVIIINKSSLEEELISIDENLMRASLDDVEFEACLRRAKEIYEQLHPKALTMEEEKSSEPIDTTDREESFCQYFAQRSNLSPQIIAKAIERDMASSAKVKKMRSQKEINASQVNHLIKLNKKDQDEILPYIVEAPKPKIKDIVKDVIEVGVDRAVRNFQKAPVIPSECIDIKNSCKKIKKLGERLLAEQLPLEGPEVEEMIKQIKEAKRVLNDILNQF